MSLNHKVEDLTSNLPTLEFKSIITEENVDHLPLRERSHCLFVNGCLHSYFYISVLNIFRKACFRIKNKGTNTYFNKFMLEINDTDDVATKVGIIGYGRLGSTLCKDLTESKAILPGNLYIQTRNREATNKLRDKGINIDKNYEELIKNCNVIFICVLASHLEEVGNKLRGKLKFDQILYIFTTGVQLKRLKQIFNHESIITESYLWNDSLHETWDYTISVSEALENQKIASTSCPLPISVTNATYINCLPKLFTLWIFSLCNIGTSTKMNTDNIIKLLNFVLFENDKVSLLIIDDIVQGITRAGEGLPQISLCSISQRVTFLDQRILEDEKLHMELLNNYINVLKSFNKYKKFDID